MHNFLKAASFLSQSVRKVAIVLNKIIQSDSYFCVVIVINFHNLDKK